MANPFKPDDKVLTLRKGIEIEATVRTTWNLFWGQTMDVLTPHRPLPGVSRDKRPFERRVGSHPAARLQSADLARASIRDPQSTILQMVGAAGLPRNTGHASLRLRRIFSEVASARTAFKPTASSSRTLRAVLLTWLASHCVANVFQWPDEKM